jgi:hypothetical protein
MKVMTDRQRQTETERQRDREGEKERERKKNISLPFAHFFYNGREGLFLRKGE